MEVFDLNKNMDKEIKLAKGEQKTFIWLLAGRGNFSCSAEFNLSAEAKLTNIFLFSADDADNLAVNVSVNHKGENSFSNTVIYGTGRGKASSSVFAGAHMAKEAKHSSAWIEGRALLFDDSQCRIDPRLEVKTSEVERVGHAAAVYRVSYEELFYMSTRGVAEEDAERLKSEGFLLSPLLKAGISVKEAQKIINPLII